MDKTLNKFGNVFIRLKIAGNLLLIFLLGVFLLPSSLYASDITEKSIIDLTNRERVLAELPPVTANELLTQAAYEKGRAIIAAQIFAHDLAGKKFSAWIKESGYEYSYVGENLALDFITSAGAVKAWMESPTHQKNILNSTFREIGVAVIDETFLSRETTLIVQIFGAPRFALAGTGGSPYENYKTKKYVSNGSAPLMKTDPGGYFINQVAYYDGQNAATECQLPKLENNFMFALAGTANIEKVSALPGNTTIANSYSSPRQNFISYALLLKIKNKTADYFTGGISNHLNKNRISDYFFLGLMVALALLLVIISRRRPDQASLLPAKN